MAVGTGSGNAPSCSGPHTGRSQEQGSHQFPNAPPSPGHTVLTGLGLPISAGDGPHSYTEQNSFQGPCDCCSFRDPAVAD